MNYIDKVKIPLYESGSKVRNVLFNNNNNQMYKYTRHQYLLFDDENQFPLNNY